MRDRGAEMDKSPQGFAIASEGAGKTGFQRQRVTGSVEGTGGPSGCSDAADRVPPHGHGLG